MGGYSVNAGLVLQSDRRGGSSRSQKSEVQSLWNRLDGKMGDRAVRDRPTEMKKDMEKKKQKTKKQEKKVGYAARERGSYFPRTRQTEAIYEQLLTFIQKRIGDTSPDVLRGPRMK